MKSVMCFHFSVQVIDILKHNDHYYKRVTGTTEIQHISVVQSSGVSYIPSLTVLC